MNLQLLASVDSNQITYIFNVLLGYQNCGSFLQEQVF